MLDFLKFLVNLYFTEQNHHGPEFLKNTLHITCKLIAPHFSDFLHSYLFCILSKSESIRKNNNHHHLFLHVSLKDQNFHKFCYICALNHLPSLSKHFQDCQKTNFEIFGCIRTSMKLKSSYEALYSYRSLSNFHFTDQNLYRSELQKNTPKYHFNDHVNDFFSSNLLFTFLYFKTIVRVNTN